MKFLKNKKFLNNKKGTISIEFVIVAALASLFLFVVINLLFPQLSARIFPWFSGQGEYATQDCDEDGIIGVTDKCPCNKEQVEDPKAVCGTPSEISSKNCPDLCKLPKSAAKQK